MNNIRFCINIFKQFIVVLENNSTLFKNYGIYRVIIKEIIFMNFKVILIIFCINNIIRIKFI